MRNILLVLATILGAACFAAGAQAAADGVPSPAPDDRVLGQANAPVTIFEYASLTCPHCAEFETTTLPQIKTNWIDTGKAKLIYRDYPLDQVALRAAMLARCAPPDHFFAFIDALFRNQVSWVMATDQREALSRIARLGGIGPDQFDQCMDDQKLADRVVAERLVATDQYGIDSTPTFFINGTKVLGAQPYDAFAKTLADAAAAAGGSTTAQPVTPPPPAASTPATPPPPAAAATPDPPAASTSAAAPAEDAAAPPPAPASDAASDPASGGWMHGMIAKAKHLFGSP